MPFSTAFLKTACVDRQKPAAAMCRNHPAADCLDFASSASMLKLPRGLPDENFWGAYAAETDQGSSFPNSHQPDAALDWCDRARHRGWHRLLLRGAAEPCASRQA